MARLIIQSSDNGKVISIGGAVFWEVFGSSQVDRIELAEGTSANLGLAGGIDLVTLAGNPGDYTVHLSGSNAVFTHTASRATVTIPMTTQGDELYFGSSAPFLLKIETTGAAPRFLLGAQELSATPAPVTGSGGGGGASALDGKGTFDVPFVIDAGTGVFNFTDSAGVPNNVVILNFSADDRITIRGVTRQVYESNATISTENDNVIFSYNDINTGNLSKITLLGVARGDSVFDVDSFNRLPVGDLVFA